MSNTKKPSERIKNISKKLLRYSSLFMSLIAEIASILDEQAEQIQSLRKEVEELKAEQEPCAGCGLNQHSGLCEQFI